MPVSRNPEVGPENPALLQVLGLDITHVQSFSGLRQAVWAVGRSSSVGQSRIYV